MFRRTATALATALAGLMLAPGAFAADPSWSMATQAAVSVAVGTWGEACGGRPVLIQWGDASAATGDPRTAAWAAWADSTGSYLGYAGQAADRTGCRIMVDSDIARDERLSSWPAWGWYCTMLVHEYGHLTGHDHSPDPANVMATEAANVFPACDDAAQWRNFASARHVYHWARGRALARRMGDPRPWTT
jgi:hypothetical protein